MMKPAISTRNLRKVYRLYRGGWSCLKEALFGQRDKQSRGEFIALDDVSMEVMPGECIGIMGRNGAGKSTLLQCIAGTLSPTSGSVTVKGRLGALLELGAGFNPDYTGTENIRLYGAMLGMNRREIREHMDEIIAFADIGEYIGQPVRTYSSGMFVRLAFAVNACVHPEVLIIDEALAVGDAPFQAKCYNYLRGLLADGTAMLFVSHNAGAVRGICDRAVWLDRGKERISGEASDVAGKYEKYCYTMQGTKGLEFDTAKPEQNVFHVTVDDRGDPVLAYLFRTAESNSAQYGKREGSGDIIFLNAVMTNENGDVASAFKYNEKITVHFLMYANQPYNEYYTAAITIQNVIGETVMRVTDYTKTDRKLYITKGDYFRIAFSFRVPLTHNNYTVMASFGGYNNNAINETGWYRYSEVTVFNRVHNILFFSVEQLGTGFAGPVFFMSEGSMKKLVSNNKRSKYEIRQ
jgi:lipopolysaccharide transport system ATP-binding protein